MFGPGLLAVFFSQNFTPGEAFVSLTPVSVEWLCSQHVTSACQQNVLGQKQQNPPKSSGGAC